MKKEYSAGIIAYYIPKDNSGQPQYLTLHYGAGHWDFPKGHLEKGETEIEAALRELKEETNLEAMVNPDFEESLSYFFRNAKGELINKKVTFFVGEVFTQQVSLSFEHQGFEWLPFNEAIKRLTFDNAKQILKNADTFLKSLRH